MSLTPILKDLHKKVTGLDIEKGNVTEILKSMEQNYTAQPGGSDEPGYEVVAEIQVEEMQSVPNMGFGWQSNSTLSIPEGDLFFNSTEYPLTMSPVNGGLAYGYNFDTEEGKPTGSPFYVVQVGDAEGMIMLSDTDLSNTTVRILKKASEPSGGGKFIVPIMMSQQGISSDVTLDQIKAAFDDKQSVVAQYSVGTGTTEIPLIDISETYALFSGFISTGEKVEIRYQTVDGWGFKRTPLKPTYDFGFTITTGSDPGTYEATPNSGVTYAAITAAFTETPNVYAKFSLPGSTTVQTILFTETASNQLEAIGMMYTGASFAGLRLTINENNECTFTNKTL